MKLDIVFILAAAVVFKLGNSIPIIAFMACLIIGILSYKLVKGAKKC